MNKRPLSEITHHITKAWPKPYFGAVPYIVAMLTCHTKDKNYIYICETAEVLVNGFLSNCSTWRGPEARAIKAELKAWVA